MPLLFQTVAQTLEELEPITGRIQMTILLAELLGQAAPDEIGPLAYLIQGRLAPEYRQKEFGVNEKLALRSIAQAAGCPVGEAQAMFSQRGDAGLVAMECRTRTGTNPDGSGMSLCEAHAALSDLAAASGVGSTERKVSLLAE